VRLNPAGVQNVLSHSLAFPKLVEMPLLMQLITMSLRTQLGSESAKDVKAAGRFAELQPRAYKGATGEKTSNK
jgi:hypothetical protein